MRITKNIAILYQSFFCCNSEIEMFARTAKKVAKPAIFLGVHTLQFSFFPWHV